MSTLKMIWVVPEWCMGDGVCLVLSHWRSWVQYLHNLLVGDSGSVSPVLVVLHTKGCQLQACSPLIPHLEVV